MNAIVTLVVGSRYQSRFARYCQRNWESYAKRHGLDLVILQEPLDRSVRAQNRSVAWQKCLALCCERVQRYRQVVWIDSDIVIREGSPNIFDGVAENEVGAVADYALPSPTAYRRRLEYFYSKWEAANARYVSNLTPQEFLTNWGLPPQDQVVQTGVLVMSPALHADLLHRTYDSYEDKGDSSWNYEMRPLSYEILRSAAVRWLDLRFNAPTLFACSDDEISVIDSSPSRLERLADRARLPFTLPTARTRALRRVHARMLADNYFLHFAGRQSDMNYLSSRQLRP